jgi:hypothetical protein
MPVCAGVHFGKRMGRNHLGINCLKGRRKLSLLSSLQFKSSWPSDLFRLLKQKSKGLSVSDGDGAKVVPNHQAAIKPPEKSLSEIA